MYVDDVYVFTINKDEIVLHKEHGRGDIHIQMVHIVSFEYYTESLKVTLINNDKYYISCRPSEFVKVSCKPSELVNQIKRLINSARRGEISLALYDRNEGKFNVYT
ncbi:hypothetical protein [Treponema denticola]|uniref:hypothetical protein n=1 Tax=Treponema denticola TaxID=158 RepID=UPI002102CE38|nr:hypothetical protein [Treponema denticola]UTY25061.1 hypothetical protein E4N78_13705 [Treponema denticola]